MTPQQLIAASFTQGSIPRLRVGFQKACVMVASELNDKAISGLKAKGYTHFEPIEETLIPGELVYSFTRIPDLETRLREHVATHFPK